MQNLDQYITFADAAAVFNVLLFAGCGVYQWRMLGRAHSSLKALAEMAGDSHARVLQQKLQCDKIQARQYELLAMIEEIKNPPKIERYSKEHMDRMRAARKAKADAKRE